MNQPDISRRNVAASVCARLHAVAAIANLFSLHRGRRKTGSDGQTRLTRLVLDSGCLADRAVPRLLTL